MGAGRIDDEIVEGDDLDSAGGGGRKAGDRITQQRDPLVTGEQRLLAVMNPDADHDPVEQVRSPLDQVEMAEGDGVETPRVENRPRHRQLARIYSGQILVVRI